ncbi:hypothetical protein HYC85_018078 [Camellia sinensis]|uniref:Fe2OG dioxygenase domain-containing protein n=1 Tax=Camellia sinensis TaxID=4442 RepID=A0A7J7GVN6_CAMSI|nr:hypothetical protein HYC85_018078 [Camellia sinensis]
MLKILCHALFSLSVAANRKPAAKTGQQLSGALYSVLRPIATEANRGIAMDFPTRRLEHACIPIIRNRAEALVNHGVSPLVVEKVKYEIKELYKLPLEEKMKYKIQPGDVEGETLESYISELQNLATTIFGLMAKALKIDKGEMEEMFDDGVQSVRMSYYPPCPQPEMVMGLRPHSDATCITILLQVNGVEGFQVKKDGIWIPVNFLPDAFVVNVGDTLEISSGYGQVKFNAPSSGTMWHFIEIYGINLQILSNGLYNSIEHRATVNSVNERMSIAMFFNPKFEVEVGPATSLLNPQNPPLFKRVSMEKYYKYFFSQKLNGKSFLDQMNIGNEEDDAA